MKKILGKDEAIKIIKRILRSSIVGIVILLVDKYDLFFGKPKVLTDLVWKSISNPKDNVATALLLVLSMVTFLAIYIYEEWKNIQDRRFHQKDGYTIEILAIFILLFIHYRSINDYPYKIITCITVIIYCLIYLVFRLIVYNNNRKELKKSSCLITLSELYYNKIPQRAKRIFIKDTEVSDDIFHRQEIVNKIYNTINSDICGDCFTISLVGPWGCGKSSILQMIKNKTMNNSQQIIVIDDFEPWIYDDKKSMVKGFAQRLFSEIGYSDNKRSLKELTNNLLGNIASEKFLDFLFKIYKEENADQIAQINDYLIKNDKKLVVYIDNLDRCNPDLIISLLKIIKNHLVLKNTVFIFSYDDEILNKQLSGREIDKKFLEKFSQMTVVVPDMDDAVRKHIVEKCIDNYFRVHKAKQYDKELARIIAGHIKTPRQLVLDINSLYAGEVESLNPIDTVLLNILRRETPDLYNLIRDNQEMFVYNESLVHVGSHDISQRNEDLNGYYARENAFFAQIFQSDEHKKDFSAQESLLRYLFPSVAPFFKGNGGGALVDSLFEEEKVDLEAKQRRICLGRFFSAYFTHEKNNYMLTEDAVDGCLHLTPGKLYRFIANYFSNNKRMELRNVFIRLRERIDELDIKKINFLTEKLVEQYYGENGVEIYTGETMWGFYDFATELLSKVEQTIFDNSINIISQKYAHLCALHTICYQCKHQQGFTVERQQALDDALVVLQKKIVAEKANMYDDRNYRRFAVKMLNEDKGEVIEFIKAIKDKVSNENKILIIADYINASESYGSNRKYHYEIDLVALGKIFPDKELHQAVDAALDSSLKETISKIIEEATDEGPVFTKGAKQYTTEDYFDIEKMAMEYLEKKMAQNNPA